MDTIDWFEIFFKVTVYISIAFIGIKYQNRQLNFISTFIFKPSKIFLYNF